MILIVDDYQDGAEALCRLLSRAGYRCQWIGSAREVLAFIRAYPPEQPLLVVMDDMMPEMTGVELLAAIRQDPKISGTTVLMYSAGFDVEHRDKAMALGAAAWILKGGAVVNEVVKQIAHWYEKVGGISVLPGGGKGEE